MKPKVSHKKANFYPPKNEDTSPRLNIAISTVYDASYQEYVSFYKTIKRFQQKPSELIKNLIFLISKEDSRLISVLEELKNKKLEAIISTGVINENLSAEALYDLMEKEQVLKDLGSEEKEINEDEEFNFEIYQ